MVKITRLNKKEMSFNKIYQYILQYEPNKDDLKENYHKDEHDEKGNHIYREYKTINKHDIIHTFKIYREIIDQNVNNDKFYLTHIYENPHQCIDLDDEEEFY